jgi:hypothetical protein
MLDITAVATRHVDVRPVSTSYLATLTPMRGWSWGWTALVAIGACLAIDAILLTVGIDELDEGYFAEQAMRLLRAELPYRDFESLYTPGALYLHAMIFKTLGAPYLIGPRVVALLARGGLAFGLYALGRPLMPPVWAALGPLFVLIGLDTIPAGWEPHPGWHSTALTLLGTWLLVRAYRTEPRWRSPLCAAAGGAGALAFLFKQNTGAFFVLAAAHFLLIQGNARRWLQHLAWIATLLVTFWLVRPYLDVSIALLVISPVVALAIVSLTRTTVAKGLQDHLQPLLAFLAGAVAATMCWLLPLLVALDGDIASLRVFVGAVEQGNIYFPPQLPTAGGWAAVALTAAAVLALRLHRAWFAPLVVASTAGLVSSISLLRLDGEPLLATLLLAPERIGFGIVSLLPPLAALAAAWLVARRPEEWRLTLYALVGVFAHLSQYPRMDTLHLAWSAPMLLALGSYALFRAYESLRPRLHPECAHPTLVLTGALLCVPIFAALPGIYLRAGSIFETSPTTGLPQRIPMLTLQRPPIVAGIRVSAAMSWQLTDIVDDLRSTTAPAESIFVYPSQPLLYVLADRPNPTRHSHVYPGLPPREEKAIIAALDHAGVRTAVVSDAWLGFWLAGGGNPTLEGYLDDHFEEVERFGVYRKLRRTTYSGS